MPVYWGASMAQKHWKCSCGINILCLLCSVSCSCWLLNSWHSGACWIQIGLLWNPAQFQQISKHVYTFSNFNAKRSAIWNCIKKETAGKLIWIRRGPLYWGRHLSQVLVLVADKAPIDFCLPDTKHNKVHKERLVKGQQKKVGQSWSIREK